MTALLLLLAHPWPLAPVNGMHPLGNNWGEYQDYGGGPYLHNGLDIISPVQGIPCYAVAFGYVRAWTTISAEYHWRVATGDNFGPDSTDGWMYAHLDPYRWHADIGDTVNTGDVLGYLVPWPVTGFDHTHFARVRDSGFNWNNAAWKFIANPLLTVQPVVDTVAPAFEYAGLGYGCDFAFARNQSATYLSPDSLYGDVDVIVRAFDKLGQPVSEPVWERLGVYSITYEITGPVNVPPTRAFLFNDTLEGWMAGVIYKDDGTLDTRGDYNQRIYYYVVTNNDGDSSVESSDALVSWRTASYPDGYYTFIVRLADEVGNTASDSCVVKLVNGTGTAESARRERPWLRLPGNPSSERWFEVDAALSSRVRLFDAGGRLRALSPTRRGAWTRFSTASLARGVYFVVAGKRNARLVVR